MFLTPQRDMKRKMSEIYISLLMESRVHQGGDLLAVREQDLPRPARLRRRSGRGGLLRQDPGPADIAEMATLAGMPTAPSMVNPVANPEAAKIRRAPRAGANARARLHHARPSTTRRIRAPMESRLHGPSIEVDAPYVAEMVRNEMQAKYGDATYTAGYQVFTTIDSRLQTAATVALRTGLLEYDRRHGWRGATAKVDLSKN